jgi:hypothetical protein
MKPPLVIGDRIKSRPCIITITSIKPTVAYGWCESCVLEHIIDSRMFNNGIGPWYRVAEGVIVDD